MSGVVMPDRSRRQPFWFSGGIGRASIRKSIRPPTLADVGGLMERRGGADRAPEEAAQPLRHPQAGGSEHEPVGVAGAAAG
ncbi:MAG TPA: hypothetical protein PLQ18_07740, partial [Plasticicumulans sp.]|nr:hypothetical protein [Plasticicumulans sp.]